MIGEDPFLEDLRRLTAGHAPPPELVVVEGRGSVWTIEPLLGQRARICRTSPQGRRIGWIDESWYSPHAETAGAALSTYLAAGDDVAEPEGWIRHVPSNRRRRGGDPALEEVRP